MGRPQIVGVVNITNDSFSDGGQFLAPERAIAQAEALLAGGADILDLGAAASNPQAEHVAPAVEIERLAPVAQYLQKRGARISIDTTKIEVQKWALEQGVEFLNDIRGFPDEALYPALAASQAKLIVMHFISDLDKAVRVPKSPEEVWRSIVTFFSERIPALEDAGIARERLIIDPGMGFFLASNPEPSLFVLAHLQELKERFGLPIFIGVSRKSFLRNVAEPETADIASRTLAAEVFAIEHGADFIRTHDAKALHEALLTLDALSAMLQSSNG